MTDNSRDPKRVRILVLEDDPEYSGYIQYWLNISLREAGVASEVIPVFCVENARQALKSGPFDLITVDGRLPDHFSNPVYAKAGNRFIDELEEVGHKGHTVFFSSDPTEVHIAHNKMVAGKNVQSILKGDVPDGYEVDSQYLAHICVGKLKSRPRD